MDACLGDELFLESAWQALKPATPMGHIAASEPPAKTISTRFDFINSDATPIESPPLAQADTTAKFGPLAPSFIDTCPEAISGSIIGTKNGLILEGPLSRITLICSEIVIIPPMPLVIIAETLCSLVSSMFN